jgi:fatty acid desaturase
LHLAGYVAAAKGGIKRHRTLDVMLLSIHLVSYLAVVLTVLSPLRAIAFILVHQCIFGFYMGLLFAPNHKGMPVRGGDSEELDWATRQVVTARNLVSNRVIDYLYGGLNYQIEHHLFPTMPSANLRRARPMIQRFCAENSLPYVETGVLASYREVSRFLGDISHGAAQLN